MVSASGGVNALAVLVDEGEVVAVGVVGREEVEGVQASAYVGEDGLVAKVGAVVDLGVRGGVSNMWTCMAAGGSLSSLG